MKRLRLLFCVGILLCLSLPIRAQDTYVSQDVYIDVGKKAYLRIPQELLSSESRRNSHDFDWSTDFPDYRVVYVSGGGSTDSWAEVMVQKKFDGVVPFYVEYKYEEYNYVWERWDERSGGYYCFNIRCNKSGSSDKSTYNIGDVVTKELAEGIPITIRVAGSYNEKENVHGCTVYATDKDNPAIPKETNISIVVPYIVQGTYDCKVTWNEYQNGSLVSKTVGPLSGLSVKKIGENAFRGCSKLPAITITSQVSDIGSNAFEGCTSLKDITMFSPTPPTAQLNSFPSVVLKNAVLTVPKGAKSNYQNARVWSGFSNIKEDGSYVDGEVFSANTVEGVSLKFQVISAAEKTCRLYDDWPSLYTNVKGSVTIPSYAEGYKVVEIAGEVFEDCNGITSVVVPNSVKAIGSMAFNNCENLTSVTIPSSVTSIGSSAFWGSNNINALYVDDLEAWLKIPDDKNMSMLLRYKHLYVNGKEVKDLVIPNSITTIRRFAFYGCEGLSSVTIPNSVTSIGGSAFSGCKNISTLYLTDIGVWLKSKNALPSQHLYIDGKEVTDIVIPNTVTSIGRVFENCEYVTSVHIPESVTEIENFAFSGCKALTSVNIPNSVTTIGENAFQVCSSLSSVTIPNSITKIDRRAFYGCKNLTEVHSLIENPFAISASTFVSYNSSTKSDYTTATLYVPKGTKSRYLSTEGWSNNFKAIEEMASGPESIKLPMMATVEVGKTITLEPEIKPEGATAVLTWESKDDKIARVKDGVVLGLKEGTTDIVVRTDNGLEDWCYVTVIDPSGIYDVSADESASSAVFSLSGQRLSAPRKGLNIIGGKKVMVK